MNNTTPTDIQRAEEALARAERGGYGEYTRAQLTIAHVHIQRAEREGVDYRITDHLWERYELLGVLSHETL